jgi:hypothetical protein
MLSIISNRFDYQPFIYWRIPVESEADFARGNSLHIFKISLNICSHFI